MEHKLESPDYQMDTESISEAGTITADNISTSSASPTISNQADSEICISEKRSGIDLAVETITKNMNSIQLAMSTSTNDKENLENRNNLTLDTNHQSSIQKLTPVRHHPLMFEEEAEDMCNSQNISNFPDVVLAHHLAQPAIKNHTDLVNSVNNNSAKSRKPIYREPSPVS